MEEQGLPKKARIGKARVASLQLEAKGTTTRNKVRLFNSNVKTVLQYGSEIWRLTVSKTNRIKTFINSSLRRILQIRWCEKISNTD